MTTHLLYDSPYSPAGHRSARMKYHLCVVPFSFSFVKSPSTLSPRFELLLPKEADFEEIRVGENPAIKCRKSRPKHHLNCSTMSILRIELSNSPVFCLSTSSNANSSVIVL